MPCFSFCRRSRSQSGLGSRSQSKNMTEIDGIKSSRSPVPNTIKELIERRHGNVVSGRIIQYDQRDLIVDDNRVNRDVLRRYLIMHGYASDDAVNGLDALKKLVDNDYKIVWMDVKMPTMTGHEATRYLRAEYPNGFGYKGTIIGVTGFADEESQTHSINIGMDNILTKPYAGEAIRRLHGGFRDSD